MRSLTHFHRQTTRNSKMAIHKPAQPLPNDFFGVKNGYKTSTRGNEQTKEYSPRRSQRLAKQHRTRTQLMHTMESSSSSSANSLLPARPKIITLKFKQTKAAIRPQTTQPPPAQKPNPEPPDHTQPSFLEKLTDQELNRALSYYYDFPQNLPCRESGASMRADGPIPDIMIKFDEGVFSRITCLRPLSEDDLESVDPFTV
ncbi:uncharacterized protein RCC_04186 [Ramularia collo-cygni]|uniref:Uncharacterized protein n=1 Tax=Ramularia collo-cygni TaxID=112498 RepID=A0A2D3UPD3_9PEZI|nr:uncharacterized protein RCC_04186 [Ramularia collo-cygni]CZT18342.1 uncharacterized protein RCC_04186 [Ramularia collo-cygni]